MNKPCRLRRGERYEVCDDEIGGASLKPADFMEIINFASQEPQR